jgi:hypothetical protein
LSFFWLALDGDDDDDDDDGDADTGVPTGVTTASRSMAFDATAADSSSLPFMADCRRVGFAAAGFGEAAAPPSSSAAAGTSSATTGAALDSGAAAAALAAAVATVRRRGLYVRAPRPATASPRRVGRSSVARR